jgi:translation initiation factor RLI1
MGKYSITVDMDKCSAPTQCALLCLGVCANKVLAHRPISFTTAAPEILIQATHPLLCDGCMACARSCEHGAISVETKSAEWDAPAE